MCSFSHFSDLLSEDQVGNQSAMSKRGQEAISNEGSPMAKPRPGIPVNVRHINLVMRSPRSEEGANSIWKLGDPLHDQKSDFLKRIDKRMLQWPLEQLA